MHLIIDGQGLQTPESRQRGIGRYSRNLIATLPTLRPDWRIELVQNQALEPIDQAHELPCAVRPFQPPLSLQPAHAEANERYFGDWLTAQAPDSILVLSFFEPQAVVPRFSGSRPPLFGILYDLIPLLVPRQYLASLANRTRYGHRFRQMLGADCLLSISEASAKDLRQIGGGPLPELVSIGGAPDPSFRPHSEAELALQRGRLTKRFGLERDFILYVGGYDLRKNMVGAMEAFAALPVSLRQTIDLAIVCQLKDRERQALQASGRELGIEAALKLPGFVSDDELRALYQMCRVFFFPSLYEGLGLPVLEALRCGAPVVASRCSSIPEVAGSVVRLADPDSPRELAEALAATLAEPRAAGQAERIEHARSFTWERSAELAFQAIERRKPKPQTPRKRRVAWVSPLPPARSGIADYSAQLLPYLAGRFDIELIVDPRQPPVAADLTAQFPVLGADEAVARHQAEPYDLFVYHVGNSVFHVYQLPLLRQFPGLLVLHDFYLGGLVLSALESGTWPVSLLEEVEHEGDIRLANQFRSGAIGPWEVIRDAPLNRRVLALAKAVLVHSAWSWGRVQQRTDAPMTRVPHFMTLPQHLLSRHEERQRLNLPRDAFIVCSLGLVGPPKRLPALLEAVGRLPRAIQEQILVAIVGEISDDQRGPLTDLAQELGIEGKVRFFGHVPLEDFSSYARAADVCVQLRYPTRGETSGALLHELAAGAACVISNEGPMAELPADVAWKVRTPDHEVEDLTAALARLFLEPRTRNVLREKAVRFVAENLAPADIAARYAALMDWTIQGQRARAGLWLEQVTNALASCRDAEIARELIEPWATLRESGQRALSNREERLGRGISSDRKVA